MRILYLTNCYSQQRQREKKANIYPVLMAMEAQKYRNEGHEVCWGSGEGYFDKVILQPEGLPFLSLPPPDRVFTRAKDYTSGNYKYLPGTHIQVANGCWHGKCSFCVEKGKSYEVRDIDDVIRELYDCRKLGFKEVFDDSGTFPIEDKWLRSLAMKVPRYEAEEVLTLGCNMRLVDADYNLMKHANFRMLLFGLESANQHTLDRINKGVKVEDYKYIIKAAKAGLEPHIAVMFGYPWETDKEALNTLKLVHFLLRKGYAKTAQSSFYTPNEGECGNGRQKVFLNKIYDVAYSPEFWLNKLKDIRDVNDLKYLWRQIKVGLEAKCGG